MFLPSSTQRRRYGGDRRSVPAAIPPASQTLEQRVSQVGGVDGCARLRSKEEPAWLIEGVHKAYLL
jgi:hypothetical protein